MACWCDELMESVTSAVTGIKDVSSPAHVIFGLVVLVGTVKLVWSTLTCTLAFLAGLLPKKSLRSYGSWAVITGATDGIGFGMFGRPPHCSVGHSQRVATWIGRASPLTRGSPSLVLLLPWHSVRTTAGKEGPQHRAAQPV